MNKWRAYCQVIGGNKKYTVGRRRDATKLLLNNNIEFLDSIGHLDCKMTAIEIAFELNKNQAVHDSQSEQTA